MADANETKKKQAVALTTPLQQTAPIGTVQASAAKIEILLQGPTKSPLVRYPVTFQVTIAARCSFDKDRAPIEKRVEFKNAGTPSRLEILLSREEASALVAVEVWAEPYAHAALLDARNGKLALGRLRFEQPLGGGPSNHAICDVHVLAGVVAFSVAEMNKNVTDPAVLFCRNANESARKLEAEAEKLRREADRVGSLKAGFTMQAASNLLQNAGMKRTMANARLGYRAHTDSGGMSLLPGGDWDHKPRIAAVWGEKNRLGDSDKVYFYDIWSNIHFGYIGHAAGFTIEEILGGSDIQQRVDQGVDDEAADKNSMREGYKLYDPKPGATITIARVLDVVAAHDEWLYDERQKEWKAAKGKK